MIKLLIVDDEPIERMALERMIRQGMDGIEIVGQAANGREAIESAARLKPDLITMDIKMPGIGGLQAIETIQETDKRVKFIVVTAYDTFDFARQALRLGVRDYLLKPSKNAVVVETIGKVVFDIMAERELAAIRTLDEERMRKMLPIVEADIVSQLLYDDVPSIHLEEMIELRGAPATTGGFVMNLLLTDVDRGEPGEGGRESERVPERLAEVLTAAAVPHWLGKPSGSQIPFIVFKDAAQSYRSYAVGLGQRIIQGLHRRTGSLEPFIGIGGTYANMNDMRKSYHEALLASVDVTLPAKYCLYEDVAHQANRTAGERASELEKQALEDARRGCWEAVSAGFGLLIDVHEGSGLPIGVAQQRIFEVLIVVTRMLLEMGYEVDKPYYPQQAAGYAQLKADTRSLVARLGEATAIAADEAESGVVATIRNFIKRHAHEDLSLERVAAEVDRNPFYVSKLFKSHFGLNYIDYLTECRMETAKQLMQDPEKSLKEITFEIGYRDPNYFSRVFKKVVGDSPTDYRRSLLRRAEEKQS